MDFEDGMVLKDKDGNLWLLERGTSGQYGIGTDWKAPQVTIRGLEFVVNRTRHIYVDSIDANRDNKLGLSFYSFVKPRYFKDATRADEFEDTLRKKALYAIEKKLTATEIKILKREWGGK